MIRTKTILVLLTALAVNSCKTVKPQSETSESKGIYADPRDSYLDFESKAIAIYRYSLTDDTIPRTAADNAFCLYAIEFDPAVLQLPEDMLPDWERRLFEDAHPITERAIDKSKVVTQQYGFFEKLGNVLTAKSQVYTVNKETLADERVPGSIEDPKKKALQAKLQKTSTGIRTIQDFVELAKANEIKGGAYCPLINPNVWKLPAK